MRDQGVDTLESNELVGFEADERLYDFAAKMLILLCYRAVALMTNNPDKVAALETAGIEVAKRVPHAFASNAHNENYLATKARAGHLF